MAKESALFTGKLRLGGLSRNSVVRITDGPDMTVNVRHQLNQPMYDQRMPTPAPSIFELS